jgi:hypothetical protein
MKFPHIFENVAALAWLVVSLVATPAVTAQTINRYETLVSTALIVNIKDAKAICRTTGCRAKTAMFGPINVTCAAAAGKTCSFHIFLDAKASFGDFCNLCQGDGADFFQFLVDDAPPTIGPTAPEVFTVRSKYCRVRRQ